MMISRWGLKGAEDLDEGIKVSFALDAGFSGTTGVIGQNGTVFGQQAYTERADDPARAMFSMCGAAGSSAMNQMNQICTTARGYKYDPL